MVNICHDNGNCTVRVNVKICMHMCAHARARTHAHMRARARESCNLTPATACHVRGGVLHHDCTCPLPQSCNTSIVATGRHSTSAGHPCRACTPVARQCEVQAEASPPRPPPAECLSKQVEHACPHAGGPSGPGRRLGAAAPLPASSTAAYLL